MNPPRELTEDEKVRWFEAVEWHALRCATEPLTTAELVAWRQWLEDSTNRRTYAACALLYASTQQINSADRRAVAGEPGRDSRAGGTRRLLHWACAASVSLAVAGTAVLLWVGRGGTATPTTARILVTHATSPQEIYRTGHRQSRRTRLSDGSTVFLGAETALTVSMTRAMRVVTLLHGEAWFHVKHRAHWPFVVKAGTGTIRDLDTAFFVDRVPGRTEVTVTRGAVQVTLNHAADGRRSSTTSVRAHRIQLDRGEQLTYAAGLLRHVRRVNPRLALEWTAGRLEFSNEPLHYVTENVSRYSSVPIWTSPAAGVLRLTTLVFSQHIPAWLHGLPRVLPVAVIRTDAEICIRLRARYATSRNNACPSPDRRRMK